MKGITVASCKIGNLPYNCHFKVFDSAILPIICYGSEVWGPQYYDVIENVQRKWCINFLGVSNYTPKEAIHGECGRLPVFVHTLKRCINYWLKLIEMPNNRLPKQAYIMLYNLDALGRNNWATSIKNTLFSYGFGFVWIAQEVGDKGKFIVEFITRVSDTCKQEWRTNLSQKPKLRTYNVFKSILEPEKYLSLNCHKSLITTFARFRCSSSSLAIEEGRHHNIAPHLRFCKVCNLMEVEDEYHFLLICEKYNDLRQKFLPQESHSEPNTLKFKKLMTTNDYFQLLNLCKYTTMAFKRRNFILATDRVM